MKQARPSGFAIGFALLLLLGSAWRVAYVVWQPATDPTFDRPILDGAYYLDQARALLAGRATEGAYYLAPLYTWALAGFIAVCGERFGLLYLLQQLLVVGAGGALALLARRRAGDTAALAGLSLFLLYAPLVFFASAPIGESLALALTAGALLWAERPAAGHAVGTGLLAGLAALTRPNLLPLAVIWAGGEVWRRRGLRAALLVAGALLVIAPTATRNRLASGHWVPVSSNAGITAYHGNGPDAAGVYRRPTGFSGSLAEQRAEATAIARRISGLPLDPVEADRWWGRRALATRLDAPLSSLRLLAWRSWLLLDAYEHGLDYPPALDRNPWRLLLRLPGNGDAPLPRQIPLVPFPLLAALALAGLVLAGWRGSGGWRLWGAIGLALLPPLLFYVSCRYRLPLAALLCVPAGVGLVRLAGVGSDLPRRRRALAGALAAGLLLAGLVVPSDALVRAELASALATRASVLHERGAAEAAVAAARRALVLDSSQPAAWHNLGVILGDMGRTESAITAYRRALRLEPGLAAAAENLAALLVRDGRAGEAIPPLRAALQLRPDHAGCWNNLVVALVLDGDAVAARQAATDARAAGVELPAGLLDTLPPAGR